MTTLRRPGLLVTGFTRIHKAHRVSQLPMAVILTMGLAMISYDILRATCRSIKETLTYIATGLNGYIHLLLDIAGIPDD